jgi:hypothetical protein
VKGIAMGGELARGLVDCNINIRQLSTLGEDGRENASITSATVDVSVLLLNRVCSLGNRLIILLWVCNQNA